MAVITTTYLAQLETLINEAYTYLDGSQGDQNTPDSIVGKVSQVKALSKGGMSPNFGIKPVLINGDLTPYFDELATGAVVLPNVTVEFGGIEKLVNGSVIPQLTRPNGQPMAVGAGTTEHGWGLVYFKDMSVGPSSSGTAADRVVIPGFRTGVTSLTLSTLVAEKTIDVFPKTLDRSEIPYYYVHYSATSSDNLPYFDYAAPIAGEIIGPLCPVYYESPGDDDVEPIFEAAYDVLQTQLTKSRASELRGILDAAANNVRSTTAQTFKEYTKSINYSFTPTFSKLWAKAKSEQLSMPLATVGTLAASTYIGTGPLYIASQLEAKTTYAIGGTTQGVTVNFYGVSPSYQPGLISHKYWTGGGYNAEVVGSDDWPSTGYVSFLGNTKVLSYTKEYSTLPNILTTTTLPSVAVTPWTESFYVQPDTFFFATGAIAQSVVYTPTQSNRYLGVASATILSSNTIGTQILIRSK